MTTRLLPLRFALGRNDMGELQTMNCKAVRRRMYLWLDGELDPSSAKDLESHVATCPACQKEVQAIGSFHELLYADKTVESPSAAFEASFWRRTRQVSTRPTVEPFWRVWEEWVGSVTLSQALAAVLVAFVLGGATGVFSYWDGTASQGHQLTEFYKSHGTSTTFFPSPLTGEGRGEVSGITRGQS